jgi:capsular exopolysaccharide synthesis family protein
MDPQLDEPDLRSYLGVLNRRKWWVAMSTALVFGLAVAISVLAEPQYEAKAMVQTMGLNDPVAVVTGQDRGGLDGERIAQGELAYLKGTTLRFYAMDAVPADIDPHDIQNINATPVLAADINQTSSVVQLTLVSSDPDQAAQLLQIFAATYVSERVSENQERMLNAIAGMTAQIEKLKADIEELDAPIRDLEQQVLDARTGGDETKATALQDQLKRKRDELSGQIGGKYGAITRFENNIDSLQFGIGLTNGTGATIVANARATDTPVSPNLPKNLTIGLVFGLILGIAVAFLRDFFDDSIKSKEVVERATGVPALGLIPKFDTADSELVTAAFPTATAAEAFRSLRTSVKFLSVDREVRVVQITSPSPGEGKTVVAANLATVFAQAGDRVVLVGGDLRRPRAEELLGVPLTPGLTGVLIGEVSLPQAIRPVDGLPNLSVLPAGYPPPNPSELLSGERARRLIDVLAQTYDLVIIDCPPVLPVTDALVLARMADTTLLVTSANKTSRRGLDRCVELLQQVGAPLVGTVLTSLAKDATYGHEPYGYEAGGSRRRGGNGGGGYEGYQATIGGYGNLADTSQMTQTAAPEQPSAPPPPAGLPVPTGDGWHPDLPRN